MERRVRFSRESLPLAEGSISVLVGHEGETPQAVFMSYESFLQVATRLYAAIDALRAAEPGSPPSAEVV